MWRFVPGSDRSWGKAGLRLAFLAHRWVGIVTCLFLAMWFASGLVMLYVPYPSLKPAQSWTGAQPIDWSQVGRAPVAPDARRITLEMRDAAPVWRIESRDGDTRILSAEGGAVSPVDDALATRVATRFAGP